MDNDRTGMMEAIYFKKEFNFKPILIPKEYNAKDFAELVEKCSINKICELVKTTIENLKYDRKNNISDNLSGNIDNTLPF